MQNRSHTKATTEGRVNYFVQQWHGAKILVCNLANSSGTGLETAALNIPYCEKFTRWFRWQVRFSVPQRRQVRKLHPMAETKDAISQTHHIEQIKNAAWPCLSTANRERGKRKRSDWSVAQTPRTKMCWSADGRLEAARTKRWQSAGSSVRWISRAAPKQRQAEDGSTLPEGATTSPVAVRTIGASEAGWLIITGSPAVEREWTLSRPACLPSKPTAQHQKMEFGPDC